MARSLISASTIIALVCGTAASALTAAPATSQDARVLPFVQHYLECAGWLVTDPTTHSANCLPSRVGIQFHTLALPGTDGGQARIVTTTPGKPDKPDYHHPKPDYPPPHRCDSGGVTSMIDLTTLHEGERVHVAFAETGGGGKYPRGEGGEMHHPDGDWHHSKPDCGGV
jgi:hypothetical protein